MEKTETKKKLHHRIAHHLSRRVYHDRYFAWAVAVILIAGSALIAYVMIEGANIGTDSTFSTTAPLNKSYMNTVQGYSVSYPSSWVLEPDDRSNTIFENPANSQESILVVPSSQPDEKKITSTLKSSTERDFSVNGANVRLFEVGGTTPTEAAFVTKGTSYFYVSGYSGFFDKFVNSFKVTK